MPATFHIDSAIDHAEDATFYTEAAIAHIEDAIDCTEDLQHAQRL